MAVLRSDESKLPTHLYIDDGETYKKGGHWKRIKFKQNSYENNPRNWAPMDLEGNPIYLKRRYHVELKQKEINEIINFLSNNKYAIENMGLDNGISFSQFTRIMIEGGEPATDYMKEQLKQKVDELLNK